MIGACAAFPAADGGLHSDITGVAARGIGAGFAIKRRQRAWALARGITTITWTFDQLVRRNAYFNLARLAARATEYMPDFYGEMPDELNAGDPSDRLLLSWDLATPEVAATAAGQPRVRSRPGPTLSWSSPRTRRDARRSTSRRLPHQAIRIPLRALPDPVDADINVTRRDRLGGLLHEYAQVA
jgi:predicted GNAT superfamily acetyltransferase